MEKMLKKFYAIIKPEFFCCSLILVQGMLGKLTQRVLIFPVPEKELECLRQNELGINIYLFILM